MLIGTKMTLAIANVTTCAQGSRSIIHTIPGYIFYSPIYRGLCDNLLGGNSCESKCEAWQSKCVRIIQQTNGQLTDIGCQMIHYINHTSCHDRGCPNITCPSGKVLNNSTCLCLCPSTACSNGGHRNPTTCAC